MLMQPFSGCPLHVFTLLWDAYAHGHYSFALVVWSTRSCSLVEVWHIFEYLANTLIFFLAGALTGNCMIYIEWLSNATIIANTDMKNVGLFVSRSVVGTYLTVVAINTPCEFTNPPTTHTTPCHAIHTYRLVCVGKVTTSHARASWSTRDAIRTLTQRPQKTKCCHI